MYSNINFYQQINSVRIYFYNLYYLHVIFFAVCDFRGQRVNGTFILWYNVTGHTVYIRWE